MTQNFFVTNNSISTQTYIFTVTSPVVPQTPATLMNGSVGLTITNTDSPSAQLDDNGNAIYTALIDGAGVQTLFNPAYALSCTPAFCSNSQSTDFGIPVPIGGPAALTSIGIRIQFDLSPGDSAGVTSVFNIVRDPGAADGDPPRVRPPRPRGGGSPTRLSARQPRLSIAGPGRERPGPWRSTPGVFPRSGTRVPSIPLEVWRIDEFQGVAGGVRAGTRFADVVRGPIWEGVPMRFLRARLASALVLTAVLSASSAHAVPLYHMWVVLGGNYADDGTLPLTFTPSSVGGSWSLDAPVADPNGTVTSWSSVYDTDPFVTNNVSVINTTGVVQTYIVGVTSPIVPQLPLTNMNGSIGMTITNNLVGSATLTSSAPNAVYRAFIDGLAVGPTAELASNPYTLTCAAALCSTTQNLSFGSPVPVLGPGANSSIGITLRFTLTPGDQASITSVFNIVAVPEPVTGALVGFGLLGLAVAGRKRA